jgi:hypothetical protein
VQLETQQRAAFAAMQDAKKQADTLWAQIQSLRRITSTVESAHTNIELHGRIKESNDVSKAVAGALDVDAVNDTMDEAHEHLTAHDEISEALAGRTLGGVVDPEQMDDEMSAFLGAYEGPGNEDTRQGTVPTTTTTTLVHRAGLPVVAVESEDERADQRVAVSAAQARAAQDMREREELSRYEADILTTLKTLAASPPPPSKQPAAVAARGK